MKKTLQLIIMLLASITIHAQIGQVFPVDGMNYTVTNDAPYEVECSGWVDPATSAVANLTIPAQVDLGGGFIVDVTGVGYRAFSSTVSGNEVIETVALPTSVTTLGEESFGNLANLTTVNLDNVEVVAKKAFVVCGKLANVGSMESVVTIGDYTFNRCVSITNYQFSNALTSIGEGAIYNSSGSSLPNYGPETINIPSSVTTIKNLNFGGHGALRAIQVNWDTPYEASLDKFARWQDHSLIILYVPTGTSTAYTNSTLWGGFDIREGTLDDYVATLGVNDNFTDGDFEYTILSQNPNEVSVSATTSTSTTINVPAIVTVSDDVYSVTAVGVGAFMDNTTITDVVLPASITLLKNNAFSGATNLENINLDYIVTIEAQNAFYNCQKLTHLDFPALTDLGNFALYLSGVTSVSFPNIVNINRGSFGLTGVTSLNIPASTQTIGTKAFIGCTSLTEIQVNWTDAADIPVLDITQDDPETADTNEGNASFLDVDTSLIKLYVPTGTTALYQAVDGWSGFNIMEGSLSVDDIIAGTLDINVTSDVLTVNSSSTFTNATLNIYDITGRLLVTEALNGASVAVNISSLASGVYIVKVAEGNAELVKRFAK